MRGLARAVRPFPWFGFRERAAARQLSRDLDRLWLDGERVEEPVSKPVSDCLVCGTPDDPELGSDGGLRWTVATCVVCTQDVAARALRRMVPKLLRERLER